MRTPDGGSGYGSSINTRGVGLSVVCGRDFDGTVSANFPALCYYRRIHISHSLIVMVVGRAACSRLWVRIFGLKGFVVRGG